MKSIHLKVVILTKNLHIRVIWRLTSNHTIRKSDIFAICVSMKLHNRFISRYILKQSMRKSSILELYVIIKLHNRDIWRNILNRFMKVATKMGCHKPILNQSINKMQYYYYTPPPFDFWNQKTAWSLPWNKKLQCLEYTLRSMLFCMYPRRHCCCKL